MLDFDSLGDDLVLDFIVENNITFSPEICIQCIIHKYYLYRLYSCLTFVIGFQCGRPGAVYMCTVCSQPIGGIGHRPAPGNQTLAE